MSRSDRVAKRRADFTGRLAHASTQRQRAAVFANWIQAALVNMPTSARLAARGSIEDVIRNLEALERDADREMEAMR